MFSALPKLADRTFIIGFFLPSLLFSLALLGLFYDTGLVSEIVTSISKNESVGKVIYLTLAIWILSILLLISNQFQYSLLEGYVWPFDRIAALKAGERHRFLAKKKRLDELANQWDSHSSSERREYEDLKMEMAQVFPAHEDHILPTRFGNVIRAFEVYSSEVYGADSVPLWPHLMTVMSKELREAVNDARAHVDFLVNVSCLSAVIFILAAARFDYLIVMKQSPYISVANLMSHASVGYMLFMLASVAVCFIGYRSAIAKVRVWGVFVKAAFDCYLPVLANKLGYQLPKTEKEEKEFWVAVSQLTTYHEPIPGGRWLRLQDKEG